ncbi:hypothetical protein GCM10027592_26070 [Spirosoma flavus]
MNNVSEPTKNDLRRIGGELARLSFELLTVTGIGDTNEDETHQKRLTKALNLVEEAAHILADIITNEPAETDNLDDETGIDFWRGPTNN